MLRVIAAAAAAGALMTLTACGGGETNTPNAEEQAQLDNIANALDTEDASADSLTVDEAPIGTGDEASAETGDVLVAQDPAGGNGAAGNAQ
jgi:hypothetical protein